MIYILILVSLLIFSIYEIRNNKEDTSKFFYIVMIFMLLFVGFRYKVGHDWNTYFHIHKMNTWHLTNGDFIEPTFTIISKITKLLSSNHIISFQILIFAYAAISLGSYTYVIDKYSKNKVTSVFILFPMYILNTVFGQIRYGVALAICLLSIRYIINKDFKKYILTILIAASFHFTAIVLIPVYFLANIKISNKNKLIILIIAIVIGLILNPLDLIKYVNDNVFKLVYLNDKISIYTENEGSLISVYFFINLFIYLFSEYIYNRLNINDSVVKNTINIIFWGVIIYAVSNKFDILAFRGSSYYFIFEILLLPNLLSYLSIKNRFDLYKHKNKYELNKYILIIFIISVAVYRLIITVFYWSDVFMPYKNIFMM